MPLGQQEKVTYVCCAAMTAIQDVIRPRLIQEGFAKCGQFPLNYEKLMGQCYQSISKDELVRMKRSTESDVDYFKQHGYLSEGQMDTSQIPCNDQDRNLPRDQSALQHQRAVCLTHRDTVERREIRVNSGLPLGNLITDSGLPKVEKKKQQKAVQMAANARKREQKKLDEKERIAAVTPEEIALEKEEKKQKAADRKRKREEAMAEAELLVQKLEGKK